MTTKRLSIQERKEIFHALVSTQDAEHNTGRAASPADAVRKSYELVQEKFAISRDQLRQIEDEGVDKEWPPLNESVALS